MVSDVAVRFEVERVVKVHVFQRMERVFGEVEAVLFERGLHLAFQFDAEDEVVGGEGENLVELVAVERLQRLQRVMRPDFLRMEFNETLVLLPLT